MKFFLFSMSIVIIYCYYTKYKYEDFIVEKSINSLAEYDLSPTHSKLYMVG